MVIDVHAHLWNSPEQLGRSAADQIRQTDLAPWERLEASLSRLDRAMQPVRHALILGFQSDYLGGQITAQQVAGYVAHRPDKYLGIAGIDPLITGSLDRVKEAADLGLVGVTICPAGQACHPAHTRAMRLYDRCAQHSLPLLVHPSTHLGTAPKLEFDQPHLFDEVAREWPTLRLLLAQTADPWTEQTLVLLAKHDHVYADLSRVASRPWQLYNLLLQAHQRGVIHKLLLGSDFPFFNPEQAILNIYSINTLIQGTSLSGIPREHLRGIVERDALSCLGISAPQSPPSSVEEDDQTAADERADFSTSRITIPRTPREEE